MNTFCHNLGEILHIPILILKASILLLLHQNCSNSQDSSTTSSGILFEYSKEPNEAAFSILKPKGWLMEGGVYRINATTAGGPLNAVEAKCNLMIKSNAEIGVAFQILPDIVYAHAGIGGGYFPVGSNYQGAMVRPLVDAATLVKSLFKEIRPEASSVRQVKLVHLPGEKESLDKSLAYTNQLLSLLGLGSQIFKSDAAGAVFEYLEGGVHYREILFTGLINMPAALTWKNTRTLSFRAPVNTFEKWRPVMDIIRSSIRFNWDWILQEAQGQKDRADFVRKVYEQTRRIDQEIIRNTTINREEMMNDNFLVLTRQEDYVNPHTGEVELDTDAFKHRWVTAAGDYYYTDHEDENPNLFFNRTDFKRTPIRKRRNE
jgi:hypothetical protein